MYAAGAAAFPAGLDVTSVHAVHVGRRAAKVADIAFEVGHLDDSSHLAQDALLRPAADELPLVCRYGAEGTASEAAAVYVDRVLYHVVCRYALAPVFGVRLPGVRQVEGGIGLFRRGRGVGRIDNDEAVVYSLYQPLCVHHVRLLLYLADVCGLCPFVGETLLVAVEHDVVRQWCHVFGNIYGLRYVADGFDGVTVGHPVCQFGYGTLAHAVDEQVGTGVA